MSDAAAEQARRLLHGARFLMSAPSAAKMPPDEGVEIAFAGRSNTGKSSTINVLCGQRSLARTSRTPGRTQHLVVFDLGEGRRLVDLPGFGYAKVSKQTRAHWEQALPEYLETRRSLRGLVLVMDVRHPLKEAEQVLVRWCAAARVPLHVLLNKSDKLGRGPGRQAEHAVARHVAEAGAEAQAQLFSAQARTGVEDVLGVIAAWLDLGPEEVKKEAPAKG